MMLTTALVLTGLFTVTDGDTVRLGNERVRLSGIDAPELRQTCNRGPVVVACGVESRDRLIAIIAGRPLRCEGRERDRYRRLVAVCKVAGTDIGRQLVADGWAVAYRRYSVIYVPEEERAHRARLGLWSLEFEAPGDWRKGR